MVTRTTSRTVTFRRPFLLEGFQNVEPAGVYTVDTEEEQIDSVMVPAWRRISSVMQVQAMGAMEYRPVDSEALHEALMRDGAQEDPAQPKQPSALKSLRDRAREMGKVRLLRRKKF